MALISTAADTDGLPCSTFAPESLPDRFRMLKEPISKDAAYQIISDELMLLGNPRLNLTSFVTTWMEPECDKLIMQAIHKNYVDMDEYPVPTELQNRCVNIIANLFKAPFGDEEEPVGVGTVGSSEAIILAGLAFKRKWQNKRKAEGKPYDKPNIVTGANVEVCWEQFARYFEVERKEVKLKEGCYVMDPAEAVKMVDENTICVAAILGSPYNGQFEDVKDLNDRLLEKGWETPIHVDATNGGFIAPFLAPDLEWDFRLELVRSINVNGQKYGLVYPRIGWVIWKTKQDLPEELIFPINYLGADRPTFTLNSCKGTSQIIAQYYQFIRLGLEGYRNVVCHCADIAKNLATDLLNTGRFNLLSENVGIPLVAFSLRDSSRHDEYEISDNLRRLGWIVPAYRMAPDAQRVNFLRVVVRQDFSRNLAKRLVGDIEKVLQELDALPPKLVREVMTSSLKGNADMQPVLGQEPDPLSPNSGIKRTDSPEIDTETPAVVYNETFWKSFRWFFPVKIRQQFIGMASFIASFCTIKTSQWFFRVLNPNIQLKNHFNSNKSRFNLNFLRRIQSPKSPKNSIIDNSKTPPQVDEKGGSNSLLVFKNGGSISFPAGFPDEMPLGAVTSILRPPEENPAAC